MSDTVIRDFLVSLGFTTDNEGARKMGDALEGVTKKSVVLRTALLALATGTVLAVAKTAGELDKLYYSSQRIGASAENIRAYGDAISQMGGDAQGALQSLESVGQKMRNSPGYEGVLQNLGVATRDGNGAMRDRVEVMKDLSKTFKDMPSYQANAYASSLGIDEKTMLAMRDGKFIDNMEKYQKVRSQVGLNDELAKSGSQLMTEFNDTTIMTKAITEVVVMTAGKALLPILKLINKTLTTGIEMFDSLNPNIKAFLATGLKIATVVVVFGGLIGVLGKIGTVLPLLKGLLFLIRGLNLAFLASPIGIVLALASAIALLWDDYQTWKNGGESLIDWSKWSGGIETAIERIGKLVEWLGNLKDKVIDITVGMWEEAKNKIVNETTEQVVAEVKEKTKEAASVVAEVKEKAKEATGVVAGVAAKTLKSATELVGGVGSGYSQKHNSKKFTPEKAKSIAEVAKRIGVHPNDLASVISFETGGTFSPSAKNTKSSATGLIQFMKGSGGTKGKYYGMSRDKFSSLSFKEQMVYVEKYFKERGFNSKKQRNVADLYTAVTGWGYKKGSSAYELNKVWDSNKDGFIDKGEMVQNKAFKSHQKQYFESKKQHETSASISNSTSINGINSNSIKNTALLPVGYNSNSNAKNVTIHQSYKAEMQINGADNPQMVANAIKRETESSFARAAHNARGIIG